MIAYVNGILESIEEGLAIVDVGGIGMNVFVSGSTMDRMPGIGEAVKLYTYTSVKEDSFTLYGFLSRDELSLFKMLISVNGIGPKGGLSILSVMTPDDLRFAIMAGDAGTISKAPGVGKKTAERITLELRDKIGNVFPDAPAIDATPEETGNESLAVREAIEALVSLGYTGQEARRAVRRAASHAADDVESILHAALREL